MKKVYVEPQVEAKNAPTGSYAAGCPQYQAGKGSEYNFGSGNPNNTCKYCECTK